MTDIDSKITANFAFDENFSGKTSKSENAATLSGGTYTSKTYGTYTEKTNDTTLTFHPATTAKEFTITNLSNAAALGTNVIVTDGDTTNFKFKAAALNKNNVTITGDNNFSVALDEDVDTTAESINESKILNNGTLNYTAAGVGEHYTKTSNGVTYNPQSHSESFQITGLKSGLTLTENNFTRSNGKITLKLMDSMLPENPTEISISSTNATNYALDYSALSTKSEVKAHWEGFNYISDKTATSWTASNSDHKVTYTAATGGNVLTTISGVKNTDGLSVSGNVVTVTNGYSLKLANNVAKPSTTPIHREISGTTANYIGVGKTAGYAISNNQIIYQDEISGDNLITISGLNSNATLKDISLSGKTATISANALDATKTVEISDGYTLALGKDVPISKINSVFWNISGGTSNCKQGGRSEGYFLNENKIVYTEEVESKNSVTVTGLKNSAKAKDLVLNGTNVSISSSAVNKGEVTITDVFSLTLGTGNYKNVSVVGGKISDTINQKGNNAVITTGTGDDFISLGSGT